MGNGSWNRGVNNGFGGGGIPADNQGKAGYYEGLRRRQMEDQRKAEQDRIRQRNNQLMAENNRRQAEDQRRNLQRERHLSADKPYYQPAGNKQKEVNSNMKPPPFTLPPEFWENLNRINEKVRINKIKKRQKLIKKVVIILLPVVCLLSFFWIINQY